MKASQYVKRLELAGIGNPQQEALWLIGHALGMSNAQVMALEDLSPYESKIERAIVRREKGEPLQYIIGEGDFCGRDFAVGEGVLVPRRDTETLIQAVMRHFGRDEEFVFVDWGAGSGCVGITLLLEFPRTYGYLVEASDEAAEYALENLRRYDLSERAKILPDTSGINHCRLVVSNPPYIPSGEIERLMRTVRDYEPHLALDGGIDGMMCYREIFADAERMQPEYIILEVGSINQVQSLRSMSSYCDEVSDDGGFPRCLVFRRSGA